MIPDELRLLIYSLNVINDKQQTKLEHFLAHCDIDWGFFLKRVTNLRDKITRFPRVQEKIERLIEEITAIKQ